MANDPGRRVVDAGRRRRPTGPSGGAPRAPTPRPRWFPGGGGGTPSGGGGGFGGGGGGTTPPTGGGGFGLPRSPAGCMPGGGLPGCGGGGMGCILGIVVIVIVIILAIVFLLQYCGNSGLFSPGTGGPAVSTPPSQGQGQLVGQPQAAPFATNYAGASNVSTKPGSWTVMLYQDADDKILEEDITIDLNEAEKAGPSDKVRVVAQLDRYVGGFSGDGNWNSTKRFLVTRDADLGNIRSQQIADLGELNMSAGETLVDFVTWAARTYPADKYALILSDHGMGWPGGWTDAASTGGVSSSIPLEARLGQALYLNEIDNALGQIRSQAGIDKFELIGLDACLMGQMEVLTALAPHARYAVTSEEVEPALGYAYTASLGALVQNPDMDGAGFGRAIVSTYIQDDQRVSDTAARAQYLSRGSPLDGLFGQSESVSQAQMAYQLGQTSTIATVDLSKMTQLNSAFNQLAFTLQRANPQAIASARTYAQNFTNVFGSDSSSPYIDLGNFLQILKQKANSAEVNSAADAVLAAVGQAVIAEKHGTKVPGSTGVAIYFPDSSLYRNPITGPQSYTAVANRWAGSSLWDDFLAYHYTGRQFALTDVAPVIPSGNIAPPAAGGITISAVTASSNQAAPGQPVTLTADINGQNIGYIYLVAEYVDPQTNAIYVADMDYLESSQTREANGVYYPDWGQGPFTLRFTWDPIVFAINDGNLSVPAVFVPESYGRTFEEALYSVDGTYTYVDDGSQRKARLQFVNGLLRHVYGFTGTDAAGAPREITPKTGDKFTVTETWLNRDSSGNVTPTTQPGDTVTFGNKMFTWESLDAARGQYLVGFIVEDLDGNQRQSVTQITVN